MNEIKSRPYPKTNIFTREQDDAIVSMRLASEQYELAEAWNMSYNQIRVRRNALCAYYRANGTPLPRLKFSPLSIEPSKPEPRPRPNRFARPDFFEENLFLLTKGAV